jgi:hypothetical protein
MLAITLQKIENKGSQIGHTKKILRKKKDSLTFKKKERKKKSLLKQNVLFFKSLAGIIF